MPLNDYRTLNARDVRFDGVFFVGVMTTGIYCRPRLHRESAPPLEMPLLPERRPGLDGMPKIFRRASHRLPLASPPVLPRIRVMVARHAQA
jgi:hypothetical protein